MGIRDLVLAIDTSNYTSSLAVIDSSGTIQTDMRKPLTVKQGERGLRQSHALFQHMENLPSMIVEALNSDRKRIAAVAVSSRPRAVNGSYMPVFQSGLHYAQVIACSLDVPLYTFSHQEGHLEAVRRGSGIEGKHQFLAYHLSGGTCELLRVTTDEKGYKELEIIGGSKDISFGQLLDRVGVAMGFPFPAGEPMDRLASEGALLKRSCRITPIPIKNLYINLSGIETQCQHHLQEEGMVYALFQRISECLCTLTEQAVLNTGFRYVLFSGGVSASGFIRKKLQSFCDEKQITICFGNPKLSSDNAVGIAYLGGKAIWQSNL